MISFTEQFGEHVKECAYKFDPEDPPQWVYDAMEYARSVGRYTQMQMPIGGSQYCFIDGKQIWPKVSRDAAPTVALMFDGGREKLWPISAGHYAATSYPSGSPCTVRIEESDTEGFVAGMVSGGRYVRPIVMIEPHNPLEAMCHYRNTHSTDRLPPEPVSTAKESPAGILACAGFDGRPGQWR